MMVQIKDIGFIIFINLCILLKSQWTSQNIVFEGAVFWNTGYSNYITVIAPDGCLHIDPGGTLHFPKQIFRLCREKQNSHAVLHQDRFHTNYQKNLRQLKSVESLSSGNLADQKYLSNQTWTTFGHLDLKDLTYFFLDTSVLKTTKYIILPNHGQPQLFKPFIINGLRKFKMRITGSQSRNYINHKKTELKFSELNIPIVYKNIWGHIVIEKVY
jgi:hypothetical protein